VIPAIIVFLYLAAVVYIGVFAFRKASGKQEVEDFFLARRSLGPFVFLMSLFGTNMTAFAILGSSGHAFNNGIVTFGLMASSSGLIIPLTIFLIGTRVWALGKKHGFITPVQLFRDRWECSHIGTLIFALQAILLVPYIIIGVMGGGTTLAAVSNGAVPFWLGGLADNTIVGPVAREGGWGYLGAGRFNLGKDEALVFTTSRGGGSYTGVQITDPWMIMPRDSRQGTLSLNNTQAATNPDGTATYALAPEDPGLANWIDTGGLNQGFFLLRWAGMPAEVDTRALVLDFQVMKLADIPRRVAAGVPRFDEAARTSQVARRTPDYNLRLGI